MRCSRLQCILGGRHATSRTDKSLTSISVRWEKRERAIPISGLAVSDHAPSPLRAVEQRWSTQLHRTSFLGNPEQIHKDRVRPHSQTSTTFLDRNAFKTTTVINLALHQIPIIPAQRIPLPLPPPSCAPLPRLKRWLLRKRLDHRHMQRCRVAGERDGVECVRRGV